MTIVSAIPAAMYSSFRNMGYVNFMFQRGGGSDNVNQIAISNSECTWHGQRSVSLNTHVLFFPSLDDIKNKKSRCGWVPTLHWKLTYYEKFLPYIRHFGSGSRIYIQLFYFDLYIHVMSIWYVPTKAKLRF